MNTTIQTTSIFSEKECEEVRNTIYELQEYWMQRHAIAPFFTLGTASYLDAKKDKKNYYSQAQHFNLILQKELSWFYEKLVTILGKLLNDSACYLDKAGLPGFHIYKSHKFFELPVTSVHCDLQYQNLDWKIEETDFTQPISYTMAIALPHSGGGLNTWDIDYEEIRGKAPEYLKQLLQIREKTYLAYEIGKLVLHSGHKVHQAAPGKDLQDGDDRITLQGHALFSRGSWQLYW